MTRTDMRCVSCGTVGDWEDEGGQDIRCNSCGWLSDETTATQGTLEFEASYAEWGAEQSTEYAATLRQEMTP